MAFNAGMIAVVESSFFSIAFFSIHTLYLLAYLVGLVISRIYYHNSTEYNPANLVRPEAIEKIPQHYLLLIVAYKWCEGLERNLLALAPTLLWTAALIKLTLSGSSLPILFHQQ